MDLGKLLVHYGVDTTELSGAETKLNSTFNNIKSSAVSGAAMIAGAAGLGGVVWTTKSVVEQFASFDDAMQKVKVVSGATGEEFGKLSDLARDMATKTEYSASEIAQGMYELSSAGMTAADQMSVMPAVLDLATSGGIEMSQAAEMVVKSLAGFNLQADQATHVTDVMAMAVNKSMLHFDDLRLSMAYIAPVAGATGQSIEDMTAALAIMSNAGIRGEQAGTTLRGAFVRLMDPTREVVDGLQKMGLSVDQVNPATHKLGEIMAVLADHTKGLDDATRNQALSMVFGSEALSGMLALVNAGPDALNDLSASFTDSAGTASSSASEMRESFSKQWEMMKNKFMDVAMDMAQALLPVLEGVTKFIDAVGGARNALILLGTAWAGLKIASWAGAFSTLGTTAAAEVGTQLSFAGMSTAGTAASVGTTIAAGIGGALVAGVAGFAIGSAIGNAIVAGANAPEAIAAYEAASDAVYEGISAQKGSLDEFANAHRNQIVQMGVNIDELSRKYMSYGMSAQEAKDMVVASYLDQGLAIETLQAQLRDIYQLQIDSEGRKYETGATTAIKQEVMDLQAKLGELPGMVDEALSSISGVPEQVLGALKSGDKDALAAGQSAMGQYAAGIASMAGMSQADAGAIAGLVAGALQSQDPTIRANAANTMQGLLAILVEKGAITADQAASIGNQITTALQVGSGPVGSLTDALGGMWSSMDNMEAFLTNKAHEIGEKIRAELTVSGSPDISYKVPAVYDAMFDRMEGVFSRRLPGIELNLGRFPMPSPTKGGAASAVEHHWHIGTLIADDRSMEQLARKMKFNYIPRVSRAMGG